MAREIGQAINPKPIDPLFRLWIQRLLVPLGAHRILREHGFDHDGMAQAIGLGCWHRR